MIDFLTIEEVADLMRCEHRTVRRAIMAGEVEAAMIGGRYLIRRAAVEAWFDAKRAHPAPRASAPRRTRQARVHDEAPGSIARLRAIEGGQSPK